MSSIHIHTRHDPSVVIAGPERAHGAVLAVDTVAQVLGVDQEGGLSTLLRSGVVPDDALAFAHFGGSTPEEALRIWLADPVGLYSVTINGERSPLTHVVLNTAIVAGPDPVAFLARLHGSVEQRLWVAPEDTGWLAGVLRHGRVSGVLREGMGWEQAIQQLTATEDHAVLSTSAGIEFPRVEHDDETGETITPGDPDTAWRTNLAEVTAQGWWQQLTPDNLRRPAYAPLTTFQDALVEAAAGGGRS